MKNKYSKKIPEKTKKDKDDTLRAENRKLRKELQQVRRELERMKYREEDIVEYLQEVEIEAQNDIVETPTCPNCKSKDINVLAKLKDDKDYYVCNSCNSRGQLK